ANFHRSCVEMDCALPITAYWQTNRPDASDKQRRRTCILRSRKSNSISVLNIVFSDFGLVSGFQASGFGLPFTSLAIHPADLHLQTVKTLACRYKQHSPVLASKTDVRRPWFGDIDVLDLFAARIKNRYAFARQIHVPILVYCHPVRTELAKELFVFQRSIRLD